MRCIKSISLQTSCITPFELHFVTANVLNDSTQKWNLIHLLKNPVKNKLYNIRYLGTAGDTSLNEDRISTCNEYFTKN